MGVCVRRLADAGEVACVRACVLRVCMRGCACACVRVRVCEWVGVRASPVYFGLFAELTSNELKRESIP